MLEPVSRETYSQIADLSREATIAGHAIRYCPCRALPETVLNLRALLTETERLWRETLGDAVWSAVNATPEGGRFFAGEVRITLVQEGRPAMVGVWLAVPPDYPRRLKVQLVDAIEPYPFPDA